MKTQPAIDKYLTLGIVLCLSWVNGTTIKAIEPKGVNIGTLQFDAVLEMNYTYGPACEIAFARYWVSPEFYTVSVVWNEPSRIRHFGMASLTYHSTQANFRIYHEDYPDINRIHDKPLRKRPPFKWVAGGYHYDEPRFSETDALTRRVYVSDVKSIADPNRSSGDTIDMPVLTRRTESGRALNRLKARVKGSTIESLELYNQKDRMLERLTYLYANKKSDTPMLRQLHGWLPQEPFVFGNVDGSEFKVTVNASEPTERTYHFAGIEVSHHTGDRSCSVDYAPVDFNDQSVPLPAAVTVRHGQSNEVIRTARIMNIKRVALDPNEAWEAARVFAGPSKQDKQFRALRKKYWEKYPSALESADMNVVRQLARYFDERATSLDASMGERFKSFNSLLQVLDRMNQDEAAFERHYRSYLSLLKDNHFYHMLLLGGYLPIETATADWGKYEMADRMMQHWIETALASNSIDRIYTFAKWQLEEGRFWTTAWLLENLLNRKNVSKDMQFACQGLKCDALSNMIKLLRSYNLLDDDWIMQGQCRWVMASTDPIKLEGILRLEYAQAVRLFNALPATVQANTRKPFIALSLMRRRRGLPDPTPAQEAFFRLRKIRNEYTQE